MRTFLNSYPVVNVLPARSRMGSVLSPYSLTLIPEFNITLKNGTKTQVAKVGFDSGMIGAHLQIPTYLARYLGIIATGSEGRLDATQAFRAQVGRIDRITAPGISGCALAGGKVLFYDGAPTLIGNDFIRDVGAEIRYEGGFQILSCAGPSPDTEHMALPVFPVVLIHKGKVLKVDAAFDTGWERDDVAVPQSIAQQLGLQSLKTSTSRTHTGTVTLTLSELDRLGMQDLPQCYVDAAHVAILPPESPIQVVIVGEGFFNRVKGNLGYDQQGPYFSCAASQGIVARHVGTIVIPPEDIPVPESTGLIPGVPSSVSWILGGVVVAGVIGLVASQFLVKDR